MLYTADLHLGLKWSLNDARLVCCRHRGGCFIRMTLKLPGFYWLNLKWRTFACFAKTNVFFFFQLHREPDAKPRRTLITKFVLQSNWLWAPRGAEVAEQKVFDWTGWGTLHGSLQMGFLLARLKARNGPLTSAAWLLATHLRTACTQRHYLLS